MTEVKIEKLSEEELRSKGVFEWPIWQKEVSRFDWHYDIQEECYILEGKVKVETGTGDVEFQAGDFVTFPSGMDCIWEIKENVRKHYSMG
ncbi:cupin domain-containing protein [Elusimicrobiota bacterium]